MVVFGLGLLALTDMPMMLADYRERGVRRRLQTTPIGPVRVLAARLMAGLTVAVIMAVLILAVAGLLIAAVTPTGRVARGIGASALTAATQGVFPTALQLL